MKPGSTNHQLETKKASKEWRHTSSSKPKKFRTQPSEGKVMRTLFWDEHGVILEHYMPRGRLWPVQRMQISLRIWVHPAIKSKRRGLLSTGVLLQHDNPRPQLPVQLLQQSKICPSNVFHIRRTRRTSLQVIFTSLDHSKRRWEASLSGPTKGCSWRCTSGCSLSQKTFFLDVSMHFRSAGILVWNAVETTQKDNVTVYLMCSINYEIKNI